MGGKATNPPVSSEGRRRPRGTDGRLLGEGSSERWNQRLEDLLQLSPNKEKLSVTGPWLRRTAFVGGAALLTVILTLVLFALYQGHKVDSRVVGLCGTQDCFEHARALNIDHGRSASSCQCFGCFVCSGWLNDYRYVNGSVTEQAILHWIATINKLSFGEYDRQAVINRPLTMMHHCVSGTTNEEDVVRMFTAFVSKRSFAWPSPGKSEEIVDHGRALEVVLELSVVWALPLWFRVHLLPVATSTRLKRNRAVMLSPSTPSVFWHFTHEMISQYQDGYSMYTSFLMDALFKLRPPSESFAAFLKTRSGVVQQQIFHQLASAIESWLPQPRLVEIGRMPELVRNLSAKDWVRALRSVYGARALDITENDIILATNDKLIKAIDYIFSSKTAEDIFFHTVWWFVQAVGATTSRKLCSSVNSIPEGRYFQRLICFDHVDTTYNVLLASISKAMLPPEADLPSATGWTKSDLLQSKNCAPIRN
ncbi:hypothetical protein MRX96_023270 [Rhipicephalus microplus]